MASLLILKSGLVSPSAQDHPWYRIHEGAQCLDLSIRAVELIFSP